MAQPKQLRPLKRRAIEALLAHPTRTAAAAAIGVDRSTIVRWCRDETFREELRQASHITLDATTAHLRALAEEAVAVLREALKDESAWIRVKAAIAILDNIYRLDADELAQRVEALEAAAHIVPMTPTTF